MPDGYSIAGSRFLHVLAILAASNAQPLGADFGNPFDDSIPFHTDVDEAAIARSIFASLNTESEELTLKGDETWSILAFVSACESLCSDLKGVRGITRELLKAVAVLTQPPRIAAESQHGHHRSFFMR